MRDMFTKHSVCLEAGMVSAFKPSRPLCVQVSSGLVWLTIEGRLDDYCLGSGQHLTIPARARVVIESLHAVSRMRISVCQLHWRTRLNGALRTLATAGHGLRRRPQRQICP